MNSISIHPLVLHGYGLVEASFEQTVDRFGTSDRADQSQMSVVGITASPADALDHLSRLTVPATRLVVVDRGDWTSILTNHQGGSDFSDHQYWAARGLGVRTIRVVDAAARWWKRDNLRERLAYEARVFELHGPDDSIIRSVACADDGGQWVFETFGDPLPIEASFDYDAPRVKDRLTRQNLRDLVESVGASPLTEEAFLESPRFGLLADRIVDAAWRERVEAAACSHEEADDPAFGYFRRGLTWVPHMATHASSVIADFERAIKLDPAYEPRVRDYLRTARKIIDS